MASGLALTAALSVPAAEAANIGIVRDAETEALLNDYLAPIVKVAKVTKPRVLIVPSQAFNAFVTSDNDMFVNVGTIIKSETPNELIGVLAHETGHLANRDVAFMSQQLRDTQIAMLLGALLGVGVAAAGAATGSSGLGQAGSAIFTTTATIGERSFLHFARDQEAAADRMAVKYLDATHQSSAGMLAVMQRLANEDLFLTKNVDPYLQDHPLPQARVVAIQSLMAKSKYTDATDPPALKLRHDLVRAKLVGFTWGPIQVNRRYPISDNSLPARYARAIVAYRTGKPGPALKQIDDLIASAPDDPYFYELKGQALLETGHPAEAIAPLRKAVALAPRATLIKILLGQALVAKGGSADAQEAVKLLAPAMQVEAGISSGYRALARAYAQTGNEPMAQLATAQQLFADGDYDGARIQATRAQVKLKKGSPAWLRADDIVSYKPRKN